MVQDTNTASGTADLKTRLRNACASVRTKSYPLSDLIPLMQEAANALEQQPAPSTAVVFDAQGYRDWVYRNLPDESLVGNGAWWADHLTAGAKRFVKAAPPPDTAYAELPDDLPKTVAELEFLLDVARNCGQHMERADRLAASNWQAPATTPQADSQPAAVKLALTALHSCTTGGYVDVDGDFVRTYHFDQVAVDAAIKALAARAPADSVTAPAGGPAMPAEFLRGVIALCTQRGYSPENIEAWAKDDKWIADLWRQAERLLAAAPPAQTADSVLKDHQIAALVNELRDIAVKFHGTQQLRERIARVVVPALKARAVDSVLEDAARTLIEAIEYTPLGVRAITAMNQLRVAIAARKQGGV